MNYQSPIEVIQTQMHNQIEGEIYKAIINVGVNVDKEELLKALAYDRDQYQKGYADREKEIVRCKDCKWWNITTATFPTKGYCGRYRGEHDGNWFCADGERKDA